MRRPTSVPISTIREITGMVENSHGVPTNPTHRRIAQLLCLVLIVTVLVGVTLSH